MDRWWHPKQSDCPIEPSQKGGEPALGAITGLCLSVADGTMPFHSFFSLKDVGSVRWPKGRWWPTSRQQTGQKQGWRVVEWQPQGEVLEELEDNLQYIHAPWWQQGMFSSAIVIISPCEASWIQLMCWFWLEHCQRPGNVLPPYLCWL